MLCALMLRDADGVEAKTLWNWPAFFDYVDFWVQEQGVDNASTFINSFSRAMWKAYRNNIVPVGITGKNSSRKPASVGMRLLGNPVTQQAVFVRETQTAAAMTLSIYDCIGALVHHAVTQSTSVIWDGSDLRRRRCAPGVYLYAVRDGSDVVWGSLFKMH